jgi:hypothetical protein
MDLFRNFGRLSGLRFLSLVKVNPEMRRFNDLPGQQRIELGPSDKPGGAARPEQAEQKENN